MNLSDAVSDAGNLSLNRSERGFGLTAAHCHNEWKNAQAQEGNRGGFRNGNTADTDILKYRRPEVAGIIGVVLNLEIAPKGAAVNDALFEITQRKDRAVDAICRIDDRTQSGVAIQKVSHSKRDYFA